MKHTKEPWRFVRGEITYRSDDDDQSFGMNCPVDLEEEANARRIVACINAMSDIDDDNVLFRRGSIGTVRKHIVTQQVQIEKLTAQRDELLAVLEGLMEIHDSPAPFSGKTGEARILMLERQAEKTHAAVSAARAIIQKVRGGE